MLQGNPASRLVPIGCLTLLLSSPLAARSQPAVVETGQLAAPEAKQAAAAEEKFVYAIDSAVIARYDRATGARLGVSTGQARHLNSGFLWEGKLYCAHSNYPQRPERSDIMVLDTNTMVLSTLKNFGEYRGSLTWVVRESDSWWCNFAKYGKENANTVLVRLTDQWQECGAWTYPEAVLKDLGQYSISGGVWRDGHLLVTGHDRRLIYRLKLPENGTVLELIDALPSPFPGQGIALDYTPNGLIGINRDKPSIIFAELRN